MSIHPVRGVLVSRDAALREAVHAFCRESRGGLLLVQEVAVTFEEFTLPMVRTVRESAPAAVFLDIEDDPATGLALARHLASTEKDLAVVLIGPPLSAEDLLSAMRSGVAEFLPKPISTQALADALPRLQTRLPAIGKTGAGVSRVYAIFGAKGGSGSSTVATNLAVEIARRTRSRTLLVDLDPELGEISLLLGVQPQFNFVDLIQNFHRMDTGLLASYIEQHSSGVHLLSAPYHPDRTADLGEDQIRQILGYLRTQYDHMVVDTSKSFSPATVAAFEQADEIFLVATVDLPSLRNIQRVLPLLKRVTARGDDQIRLVVNRYNPNDEISLKDVEKTLGLGVYATVANDYEAVMGSINTGKPVVLSGGKSAVVRDLRSLADRVVGSESPNGTRPPKGGLLGKMAAAMRSGRGSPSPSPAPEHGS